MAHAAVILALAATAAAGPAPKSPATWEDAAKLSAADVARTMAFVNVRAGRYGIGAPDDEPEQRSDESPRHDVIISRAFAIGRHEVTQGEWLAVMGTRPAQFAACGPSCPVESVNWFEAAAFANALSRAGNLPECYELEECNHKKPGTGFKCLAAVTHGVRCRGYRLPTEAEWETAARGGNDGPWHTAPKKRGTSSDALLVALLRAAWIGYNADATYDGAIACPPYPDFEREAQNCGPQPVGGKSPNRYGLYDVIGNVAEWTGDWYSSDAYWSSDTQDPTGAPIGDDRVVRGGDFMIGMKHSRVARRRFQPPSEVSDRVGFRVVRTIDPP